jgi:beta-N-acetylhexosaminidase
MSVKLSFKASLFAVSFAVSYLLSQQDEQNIQTRIEENLAISTQLNQMSVDEKIGQMIIGGIDGYSYNQQTHSLINEYKIGGFILYANNIKNTSQTVSLLNEMKEGNKASRIPLFLSVDQEGGNLVRLPKEVVALPSNRQIGKRNDLDFSYEIGQALGTQLNLFGFNMNFAPVLDVDSNPLNPVIGSRSFGADVNVVSRLGLQTMKGLQAKSVVPVVKHFPGHGDTSVDSHLNLPVVNKAREELELLELLPFRMSIENGADAVMVAHILLPEIDAKSPSSMSSPIITNILRNELGFKGVVMTDDMTMAAITKHYEIGEASVNSVKAGSDIIMVAHDYDKISTVVKSLKKAVETGELTEQRIDLSVTRILKLKNKYELQDISIEEPNLQKLNEELKLLLSK